MEKIKLKHIAVKPDTYLNLLSLGRKNESFDILVKKLLDEHRGITEKVNTVSESGSDLGRDLDQIPTTEGAAYNSLAR